MKIKLDDTFTLCSDRYNVWIAKTVVAKKGRNAGKAELDCYDGWHKNIEDCFESFFELRQKLAAPRKRKNKDGTPISEKAKQTIKEDKLDAKRIAAIEEDMTVQELIKTIKEAKKEIKGWCAVLDKDIKIIKTDRQDSL